MSAKRPKPGSSRCQEAQNHAARRSKNLVTSAATAALREDPLPYRAVAVATPHSALRTPRFIDLFCGIGGFRIAFERAGARCVFSCDWDKHSQITYAANFGETPHGDIHDVALADIPKFDILCAGFPCRPFSIAGVSKKLSLGRKHGFEDEKQGNLFFDLAAIISFHQPPAFVLENVKHLQRHDQGRTFEESQRDCVHQPGVAVPEAATPLNKLGTNALRHAATLLPCVCRHKGISLLKCARGR